MQEASYTLLVDRVERGIARMACVARHDILWGGFRAARIAERLRKMGGDPRYYDAMINVYHTDDSPEHTAYHCPECDEVVLGYTAASNHCMVEWY